MTDSLTRNSRAVVTGAGSGIGRAFALELARRGGRVVCADLDQAAAGATVDAIREQGGQEALAVHCDVSRLEQVEALAERAAQWFGESRIWSSTTPAWAPAASASATSPWRTGTGSWASICGA